MNHSVAFYRSVLNHLNEGVYFVDANRMITYWNGGAEKITGYSEAEVLHKHCQWNLLQHTDSEGINLCNGKCPLVKTLTDGTIREDTLFLQHKNGYRVPVFVRVLPIRNSSSQIVGAVEIFTDLTPSSEHGKKMKALATLAYFDLVTGLPNRRYMETRISKMLSEYKKNLSPFGLLLINIVGFKMLNDKFGPEVGDQVLRSVSRNIAAELGPAEIAGRWDGTRFLVLSPNTKKALLILLAEKLKVIANRSIQTAGPDDLGLRISMSGALNQMNDTTAVLQQRLALYIQESESRDGTLVMDED